MHVCDCGDAKRILNYFQKSSKLNVNADDQIGIDYDREWEKGCEAWEWKGGWYRNDGGKIPDKEMAHLGFYVHRPCLDVGLIDSTKQSARRVCT